MGWLQKQHEDQSNGVSTFIILLYIYTHISTFEQCNIRIEITNIIRTHIKKRMICYRINWIIWYKAKSIIILFDKKEPRYIHYMVSFKTITYVSTHTHTYISFSQQESCITFLALSILHQCLAYMTGIIIEASIILTC